MKFAKKKIMLSERIAKVLYKHTNRKTSFLNRVHRNERKSRKHKSVVHKLCYEKTYSNSDDSTEN